MKKIFRCNLMQIFLNHAIGLLKSTDALIFYIFTTVETYISVRITLSPLWLHKLTQLKHFVFWPQIFQKTAILAILIRTLATS